MEPLKAHLKGRYRYEKTVKIPGDPPQSSEYSVEFGSNAEGTYLWRLDEGKGTKVSAFNPDYVFGASQAAEAKTYVLEEIRRGSTVTNLRYQIRDNWEKFVWASVEVAGVSMPRLVSSERFTLLSFEEDGDIATMSFKFARLPNTVLDGGKGKVDTALEAGTLKFSKTMHWAITGFDYKTFWGRVEGSIRYQPFEGTVVPEFYERRMYGDADKSETRESHELVELQTVAADAPMPIRLEDYGLSSSTANLMVSGDRNLWIVVLNIVLLAGLLCAYAARRKRRHVEIAEGRTG